VSPDLILHIAKIATNGMPSQVEPEFLITPANGSLARCVGNRPGTHLRWQANQHLWFRANYGIFFAGPFLKQAGPGRNLNYWALWAGYEF
jgi:hypothetical protein